MQGTKINVLDRGLMPGAVGAVLASSSFGLADAYPIGGSVSSAGKTVALHKALQQINGMAFGIRDQILEIFPYGTAVAQIVMLMQERLEEGALWSPGLAQSRTFAKHQWRQRLESLSQE